MNIVRQCIYCSKSDTDPKHEQILPGFISVYAHQDCCAQVTKCETCTPVVKAANGLRGEEFRKFLSSGIAV